MEIEIWRRFRFDKNYMVSNHGRVKNYNTGKLLTPRGKTYKRYALSGKDWTAHRLVALTFIPNDNPEVKTQIDHIGVVFKDGTIENKQDNRVDNLQWISQSDNLHKGNTQERKARAKMKRVRLIHVETGMVLEFNSNTEAYEAGFKGVSGSHDKINKTSNGYYTEYI